MSRIIKYKKSLYRFIRERTKLFSIEGIDSEIPVYIYDQIEKSNLIYPVLFLTIMNNQNKKKGIGMQGYHLASVIAFINIMLYIAEKYEQKQLKNIAYHRIYNHILVCINDSMLQNLQSLRTHYKLKNMNKLLMIITGYFNNTLNAINRLPYINMIVTENECHNSMIKWYFGEDNNEAIDKLKKIKQIDINSINEYIRVKYNSICELSIKLGWMIGNGDDYIDDDMKSVLDRVVNCFNLIYKITKDFNTIEESLNNKYSKNYVLNYGIQKGYEIFLDNKQKFINDVMCLDIYTHTIREIIEIVEEQVDVIINNSSPELKSTFSSSILTHSL